MNTADPLLTGADVARLAGVRRPAVNNWQRRHPDFPAAIHSGGMESFPLSQVMAFLDGRVIRPRFLADGEQHGTTYGDRARRSPEAAGLRRYQAVASAPGTRKAQDSGRTVAELMGPVAERIQGDAGARTDYVTLIASVAVLRACRPARWSGLLRAAPPRQSPDEARRLLRRVGDAADDALRGVGILPGVGRSLDRLRPSSYADVQQVIRLAGELGADDFPLLLEHFEEQAGLKSGEFFTPRAVTRMMAELLVCEEDERLTICDPYLRGGELLAAAVESVRDTGGSTPSLTVRGTGSHEDTLRLAGMHLQLHGVQARLEKGGAAPWNEPDQLSATADRILLNPPFSADASAPRDSSPGQWPYGQPPPGSGHFAWVQHVLGRLGPRGRAAMLMPNNALSSASGQERDIRRNLVEQGRLECVIALPAKLFRGTTIPVSVWLLRKEPSPSRQVLFVDARRMGVMKSRTRRVLTEEDTSAIVQSVGAWHTDEVYSHPPPGTAVLSTAVEAAEVRERDYSLNPADYVVQAASAGRDADELEAEYERRELMLRRAQHLMLEADRQVANVQRKQAFVHPVNSAVGSNQWEERPLGELCDIQAGPSPSLIKRARSEDGDVPVVQPKHLRDRRVVAPDQVMVLHEHAERLLRAYRVAGGDILCVRTGTTGPSALVEPAQHGWILGSNLLRIRPSEHQGQEALPEYLLAFLSLPAVEEWIRARSTATTSIGSISAAALGRLPVPLPTWDEQVRIGGQFRAYDQQIVTHREFAEAAEHSRTALAECVLQRAASVVQPGTARKEQGD
ncbi:N-6 DNA methylase [Streptomyces sp. HNM0575]|uniref:N-6 DNA methylase n=1 Tax=Streptomyces sp. HNM0575 TaxID=2716338 RepID=UPI00145E3CA5|nr:N-6 DNA methylase [Streptomyces sp. HNM0575]NLU75496.1 N-6 DNA methylase [Streptomyces sp. HNM0575]